MSPITYNATLANYTHLTSTLGVFYVQPDDAPADDAWFRPGQYVTLSLNATHGEVVRRPMTLASAPHAKPVEFLINRVHCPRSSIPFTHLLWQLQPGDRLHMRRAAAGRFTVHDTIGDSDSRARLCLAKGTGIAPFASMVRSAKPDQVSRFTVVHEVSEEAELAYRGDFEQMKPLGLQYVPMLTMPRASWAGATGTLQTYVTNARANSLSPHHTAVFVCGLGRTIASVTPALLTQGYLPAHRKLRRTLGIPVAHKASAFFEQFDSERLFDIENPDVVARLRDAYRAGGDPASSS